MKKVNKLTSVLTVSLFLLTLLVTPNGANKVFATTDFSNLQAPITATSKFSDNSSSITAKVGQATTVDISITANDLVTTGATTTNTQRDIVLVVDISPSMDWEVSNSVTKLAALKTSAKAFVAKFADNDSVKIAIVGYSLAANKQSPFYSTKNQKNDLNNYIDNIEKNVTRSGTNIGDGLKVAKTLLDGETTPSVQKYILLMTDGYANYSTVYNEPYMGAGYWTGSGRNKTWHAGTLINSYRYSTTSTQNKDLDYVYDNDNLSVNYNATQQNADGQTYAKLVGSTIKSTDIKSFMLGFFTDNENSSYLNAIATSAGGNFLTASDTTSLNAAFDETAKAMNADYTAKDFKYTISIPSGLSVNTPLPSGLTLSSDGRKLTYLLGDIGYSLQADKMTYKPIGVFPRKLSFTLTSTSKAEYTLSDGLVSFTDLSDQTKSIPQDSLKITVSDYDLRLPTLTLWSGSNIINDIRGERVKTAVLKATDWGSEVQDKWYSIDDGVNWLRYTGDIAINTNGTILAQGTRTGVSPAKSQAVECRVVNIDNAAPTGDISFVLNRDGTVKASIIGLDDAWGYDAYKLKLAQLETLNPILEKTFTIHVDPTTGKTDTITATFTCKDDLGNSMTISKDYETDLEKER